MTINEDISAAITRDRPYWFSVLDEEPEAEASWLAKEMEEYYAVALCPREPGEHASDRYCKWYERRTDQLEQEINAQDWLTDAMEMMDEYAAHRQREYVANGV